MKSKTKTLKKYNYNYNYNTNTKDRTNKSNSLQSHIKCNANNKNKTKKRRHNDNAYNAYNAYNNEVGGEVIDTGGYGCIFRPALKCNKKDINRYDKDKGTNRSYITKLMTAENAEKEYNDIVKYKKELSAIPNYKDYYLVDDIFICTPDKLSKDDLKHYKNKCRALPKRGITKENINNSLDKMRALNMPDGGLDIGNWLTALKNKTLGKSLSQPLVKLNNSLIDLLNNGIVPMNNKNIYHCDIKESNILVEDGDGDKDGDKDEDKLYTRLIDWGLSTEYEYSNSNSNSKPGPLPKILTNRSFQYNMPFSGILFNLKLNELYEELLIDNPSPDYYLIRGFAIDYILVWLKERGVGHFKIINNLINCMFMHEDKNKSKEEIKREKSSIRNFAADLTKEHDKEYKEDEDEDDDVPISEYVYTYYYVSNYLTEILSKYTRNGKLYLVEYFNEVFIKNLDLWGFIISYSAILEELCDHYDNLSDCEIKLFEKIKQIIIRFLFETAITPIDVNHLTEELKGLNGLFRTCVKPFTKRLSSSSQEIKNETIFTETTADEEN
jgi:hypothetical protein